MTEADTIAMMIVHDHGVDAPAYVMRQIEAARGYANIAHWGDVGMAVAALLEPKGLAN